MEPRPAADAAARIAANWAAIAFRVQCAFRLIGAGTVPGRIRSRLPHCAAYGPRPAVRPGEARRGEDPNDFVRENWALA